MDHNAAMPPLDLTPEQIAPAFPGAKLRNITVHWPFVRVALEDARLTSARIVAYSLGTIAAETAGFVPITELPSRYNTLLGGEPYSAYEMRGALGNSQRGDGARFPGRGYIQLTGRANYAKYGERIGVDLLADPDAANDPQTAANLLALFIADKEARIVAALSDGDMARARKAVNGGTHGLDRFTAAYNAILRVLQ